MTSPLENYISQFEKKLAQVNIEKLELSGYAKEYLQLLLDNRLYYLHIYADVFDKVLQNTGKKKKDIVFVDYGAGNGLLGLFAKFCDFKKVYLADVSEAFIDAAMRLADELGIDVDGFLVGDCNVLVEFCETEEKPDAVAGTDVIEHIYDLDIFFSCLKNINPEVVTVFTTASVTANPVKNRKLKQLQRKDELTGSEASHSSPDNEYSGLPFLEIRKRLIKKHFMFFDKKVIDELAVATRGMNESDIIAACSHHFLTKEKPEPLHPTNTCDPITGSWTERLLTVKEYKAIYNKAGFALRVHNGFYNEWQGGKKATTLKLLNKTIALLGKQGRFLSSYITLVGK